MLALFDKGSLNLLEIHYRLNKNNSSTVVKTQVLTPQPQRRGKQRSGRGCCELPAEPSQGMFYTMTHRSAWLFWNTAELEPLAAPKLLG